MTKEFKAIKAAARNGWDEFDIHWGIAEQFCLPKTGVISHKVDAYKQPFWMANFNHNGPLKDIPAMGTGKTRAEAAARLILEAKDYLAREERAKVIGA